MGLNNGNQMRQVSFTIHYASHLYPCEIWNCVENGIKKAVHIFLNGSMSFLTCIVNVDHANLELQILVFVRLKHNLLSVYS